MKNLIKNNEEEILLEDKEDINKKKYELLIDHRIALNKIKEEKEKAEKNKLERKDSDLGINLIQSRSQSKEIISLDKKETKEISIQRTESEEVEEEKNPMLEKYNENKV